MYKVFLMVAVVCFGMALATVATADDGSESEVSGQETFECQFNLGLGGAPWMEAYDSLYGASSTASFTGHVAVRFRLPKYTPLVLEVSAVFPYGVGVALGLDIVHTDRVRLHIGDFGMFGNLTVPVSVARLERKIDIVFGVGAEVKLTKTVSMTLDWRVFMPPPITTFRHYGDFARPMYDEALKGGQIWIGFSRVW